ncbi:ABC-2 type transport system ATP-binding protein [Actinopolyspora xinjiangensis]|uniref:ABC-2 type transport system ATP-binding protein n=1 Tax=Actinopolyspora xinjiangensis TaxID=405564 RepID=A0A1H0QGG1_9ACTN|nr:ABC transporter ATP-binding protein [Actinopolyspora xinjiangensis]SDP16412.1 ABC-2 type transport system ATP-binding protein [Actinopolyspora xinjiangensis]
MTRYQARAIGASRRFGSLNALDGIDLDISAGEILGLLGPNGAGKTTLLNLLTGLRAPDSGRVELFGGDPRQPRNRQRLGTTPQETGLPDTLRVAEIVEFVAKHYPKPLPVDELLERFGLSELAREQAGSLSGGQQRRLSAALAFAGDPGLVVLDEPTTGLDVAARDSLWEALRHHNRRGTTVLLTSHYLAEVEALAERIVVMDRGRVLADGPQREIKSRVRTSTVTVRGELPELPGVVRSELRDGAHRLLTHDSDRLVRDLVRSGVDFEDLTVTGTSLEEAFTALTSTGNRTDETAGRRA